LRCRKQGYVKTQSQIYVTTDDQSASLSWCQAFIWGLTTRFLLLSDSCGFVDVGHSLWRENGSAVYKCCWFSPAQSFLGPSPGGLVNIFYCLRFESPQPEWQVFAFISPRNSAAQLYPQTLSLLYVSF
jgi:hypothetical protein